MQSDDLSPEFPSAKALAASCVARAWDDSIDDRDRLLLEQASVVIEQLLRRNRSLRRFFRRQRRYIAGDCLPRRDGLGDVISCWINSGEGSRMLSGLSKAFRRWAAVDADGDPAEAHLAARLVDSVRTMTDSLARASLNTQVARHQVEQAFRELEGRGYFAKQAFACCSNCAWAELETLGHSLVVFSNMQSDVEFRSGGDLYLQWQGNSDEIVAALRAQGLQVDHDGRRDRAIRVLAATDEQTRPPADAQWRRRSSDDAGDGAS